MEAWLTPYSARKRDCSLWKIRVKNNKWPSESNSATLPTPPALKPGGARPQAPKPPDASAGLQLLLVSPAAPKALKRKVLV